MFVCAWVCLHTVVYSSIVYLITFYIDTICRNSNSRFMTCAKKKKNRIKERKKQNVYMGYKCDLCYCCSIWSSSVVRHLVFFSFKCYIWICFALLCLCLDYFVVCTIHEFIYLISFHVQIENQYRFRLAVCAAEKLEWWLQIGYYINRKS